MTLVLDAVELPNGVKLPYAEQGDPSGVPVVFLHGVTDSWHSFELVLPHLPAFVRAFALTQRGHGDADRPAGRYDFDELAADVAAFFDAVGLEKAIVAGHSMGSYVAQRFAMSYPERAQGLVLIGSFATGRNSAELVEFWESEASKLEDPIDPSLAREFQAGTLARPVPQAFFETAVRESLKVPARVWREAFRAHVETDYSGELGKIEAPTLILWGDKDALFSRGEQDTLAAGIANSRLVVYPGVGHALHWEAPEQFAADLVGFVRSLAG